MSGDARAQASERIAARFTRVMNATTSPRGQLCDLSMAALLSALPLILIVRQAAGDDLRSATTAVLAALAALPIVVSLLAGLSLRNARETVIDWLAARPFPVENLNSILAGISDEFEIHFAPGARLPAREELQKLLDPFGEDTLAMSVDEERRFALVKLGVFDTTRLPLRGNYQRYSRFQRLIEEVVTPLHQKAPVASVLVV